MGVMVEVSAMCCYTFTNSSFSRDALTVASEV